MFRSILLASMLTLLIQGTIHAQSVAIGSKAPEIELTNPEGKLLKLSSLQGHVVLIDFWASWCGPCRRANPNVVAIYNKYKNQKFQKGLKGFTIFNVSLDKNKEAWVAAIKQDGLEWPNHVSDLKGWAAAPAILYGIRAIPTTILIDEEGIVIAINPSLDRISLEMDKRLITSPPIPKAKTGG